MAAIGSQLAIYQERASKFDDLAACSIDDLRKDILSQIAEGYWTMAGASVRSDFPSIDDADFIQAPETSEPGQLERSAIRQNENKDRKSIFKMSFFDGAFSWFVRQPL